MYKIRCAEIWGGTDSVDEDICTAGIVASVYSNAYDGERGGDIYYFSVCENDRLTRLAIADVAGHGSQVSDVSAQLYEVLEKHMNDTSCDIVLEELNDSALEHGIRALTTAAVVGFYTLDRNLYFAYAGHGPAYLRRNGQQQWLPLELDPNCTLHANAPLGVVSKAAFDQQRLPLAAGDRLFLHTDGITEAMDAHGTQFGEERLLHTLTQAGGEALPALKRAVLDAVAQHTSGHSMRDDVTLLAVEVTAPAL